MKKKDSLIDDRFIFAQLFYIKTIFLIIAIRFPLDNEMNIQWLLINLLNFLIVPIPVSYVAYKLYRQGIYKIYALALVGGAFIASLGSSIFPINGFGIAIIWFFIIISVPLAYLVIFKENKDENSHFQIFRIGLALLLFLTARNLPISIWYAFNNELPKSVPISIGFIMGLGVAYFSYKYYRSSVYKTYVYSFFGGFIILTFPILTINYHNEQLFTSLFPIILLLPSLIDLALGARKDDENNRLPSIETGS